jgi:hypothetical protein
MQAVASTVGEQKFFLIEYNAMVIVVGDCLMPTLKRSKQGIGKPVRYTPGV